MFFTDAPIPDLLVRAAVLGPVALAWIALTVRFIGLRSFSKMTAVDFISTVATGSLLANAATATEWLGFFQSVIGVTAILSTQALIAILRRKSPAARRAMENEPTLLMRDGVFERSAMEKCRVHEDDVIAKLREANVTAMDQVRAVVLETTGDISVLHDEKLEERLITDVARVDES